MKSILTNIAIISILNINLQVSYGIQINHKDNQPDSISYSTEEIEQAYEFAEIMPEFPGGNIALRRYIEHEIVYPQEAAENWVSGKVYTKFIISETGKVTNAYILRGTFESLDEEALRVIKSLPDFTPGRQGNKPVSVYYIVPINFRLK